MTAKVDFAHVRRMSDSCGIAQHAVGATPDRRHGYCVDDNARALIAALYQHRLTGDKTALKLADDYLAFLLHAMNDSTGRFRNFMDYGRNWLEERGSEDSHGRAVWALGVAVRMAPSESMRAVAARLMHVAARPPETFTSPRAAAFTIIGLHQHLAYYIGDVQVRRTLARLAEKLFVQFQNNSAVDSTGNDWPWLENIVTYDNAKLPHALLVAGEILERPDMIEQALKSLQWLIGLQVDDNGIVSLIGNDGWLSRDGSRARFDQQPVEAMALVEACVEAARITGDSTWTAHARTFLGWFTGSNELGVSLIDIDSGGCCDGLHTGGLNMNQGAESTLAWVIAGLTLAATTDDDLIGPADRVDHPRLSGSASESLLGSI